MTLLACSCGKTYDTDREPGTRVRCRVCSTVLVVPEPTKSESARFASERLRKARGESCALHPRELASGRCERCTLALCPECAASPPALHLCKTCASSIGAAEAFPLDFGLLATPWIAARATGRAFGRLLVFNAAGQLAMLLVVLGLTVAFAKFVQPLNPIASSQPDSADAALRGVLVATFVGIFYLLTLYVNLVFLPAADVSILDNAVRERTVPLAEDLRTALARALSRQKQLAFTFLLLVIATVGALLVASPLLVVAELTGNEEFEAAAVLLAILATGGVLGSFGLAVPAVILEHRTAPAAFGRAWDLARRRPAVALLLGSIFAAGATFVVSWEVSAVFKGEEVNDVVAVVIPLVVTFAVNLAWPALLVAAYHGLVAEEAGLMGRRS